MRLPPLARPPPPPGWSPGLRHPLRREEDEESLPSGPGVVSELRALLSGAGQQLAEWEGLVRSHQAPSRLVQWASSRQDSSC